MTIVQTHRQSCDQTEPLGYQHFLYDVNINYSKGGNQSLSECNTHSFKLKFLPYMIQTHRLIQTRTNNDVSSSPSTSSNSSINNCDQFHKPPSSSSAQQTNPRLDDSDSSSVFQPPIDPRYVDVTKETSGFLGNSDYVPNYGHKYGHRRVVLELISAKLSQTPNLPSNLSNSSLVTLAEQQTITLPNGTPLMNRRSPSISNISDSSSGVVHLTCNTRSPTSPPPPSPSSKRFVNYTILIKTLPGLDRYPTVIERRFSDFLMLYQRLMSTDDYAKILDREIIFPKKVYMGNFSLTNIAERSIEFMRLLNLCMKTGKLLWSKPFISFLMDKELEEAHRLSLYGDPDDVQIAIETVYFIQKKLYLDAIQSLSKSSTISSDTSIYSDAVKFGNQESRSALLSGRGSIGDRDSSVNAATISKPENDNQLEASSSNLTPSLGDSSEDLDSSLLESKRNLGSLNQRLLVTFVMLFLSYYRAENYDELKLVVDTFNKMISSQEFVENLLTTPHYTTLRACILFLMNLYRGDVINDSHRLWLKRRLEDIDGAHADLNESLAAADSDYWSNNNSSPRNGRRNSATASVVRITKGDLTSLIRGRNFCTFQD